MDVRPQRPWKNAVHRYWKIIQIQRRAAAKAKREANR
jgi:hypothetical protein